MAPSSDSRPSTPWRGLTLQALALLHVLFVLLLGLHEGDAWLRLRPNFGSANPPDLLLLTLFWSLVFGFALFVVGAVVRTLERAHLAVPRSVSALLLALGLFGTVLAPASGFPVVAFVGAHLLRRP
ncbi:MAG: DUF6463 family protein [Polyangiaceae bacterium]